MKPLVPTLLAALLGIAAAQGSSPLNIDLSQLLIRVIRVDGKATEQRVPDVVKVRPGDVLAQVVTARNTSGRTLQHVAVKLPVPPSTLYLTPDGPVPNNVRTEYSIDGGKTFAPAPLMKRVPVTENGQTVLREVEVQPQEYQAVRWTIAALPAGTAQQLGFRVQVK